MLSVEVAEGTQADQVLGFVAAAVGAIRHVVERHVLALANRAAALVAVSAMDRLPAVAVARHLPPAVEEGTSGPTDRLLRGISNRPRIWTQVCHS